MGTNEAESAQQMLGAPVLAPPKGGDAMRGIGEKFAVNPATITDSISVPVATNPGAQASSSTQSYIRLRLQQQPVSFGWSLSIPTITRKTDKEMRQHCKMRFDTESVVIWELVEG